MKVIYIAGPFRAENAWRVEQNIRAAEETALDLWNCGYAVICPHANTRYFDGAIDANMFLEGDLEILSRCDALFMLPKWETSVGATEERRFAVSRNIPVFDTFSELFKHFDQPPVKGAR